MQSSSFCGPAPTTADADKFLKSDGTWAAAGGGGGGGVKTLTADDYNWNSATNTAAEPYDSVALWLLEAGMYKVADSSVIARVHQTSQLYTTGVAIVGEGYASFGKAIWTIGGTSAQGVGYYVGRGYLVRQNGTSPYGGYIGQNVINRLDYEYANAPLSANQGKVLNDKIGGNLSNLATTDKTSLINAINEVAGGSGGGGGVIELTADDYNAPASNPTSVALALLEPGVYTWKNNVNVRIGEGSDNLLYYQGRTAIVGYGNAQGSSELRKTVLLFGGSQVTNYTDYPARLYILSSNNWTAESSKTILTSFSIVDNLTSNYTYLPLSAKQGKVLNDKITALEARVAALEGN